MKSNIYKTWLNEAIQKRIYQIICYFEKSYTLIDMKTINNVNRIKDTLIVYTDHYDEDIIISGYNGKDKVAVKENGSFDLKPTIKLPSYTSGLVFPTSTTWVEDVFNLEYMDARQLLNKKNFQIIMQ